VTVVARDRPRDAARRRPDVERLPALLSPGGRHEAWLPGRPAYVALDVDGTLLTDASLPDRSVLRAITALTHAGVHVGLATGRMTAANRTLLGTGVFTGPHVFHNGAVVQDTDGTDRVVHGLDEPAVDAVLAFGRGRTDVTVEIYLDDGYLTDRDDPRSAPHHELLGLAPSGRIHSSADLSGRPAIKAVVVCFSAAAAAATIAEIPALGLAAGPAASPATPRLRYVNVTRIGVDKGSGVLAAAGLLGVPAEQVAVIGDEVNDVPMLVLAGTAIVMGEARDEVRAQAHLVAPGFHEGGTTAALEAIAGLARAHGRGDGAQREPGTW